MKFKEEISHKFKGTCVHASSMLKFTNTKTVGS